MTGVYAIFKETCRDGELVALNNHAPKAFATSAENASLPFGR